MFDLTAHLSLSEPIRIVDIGANPIESAPPYQPLIVRKLARITGFEPQPEALETLRAAAGLGDQYLPYIVGDGQSAVLYVTEYSGCTSTLKPRANIAQLLPFLGTNMNVIEQINVQTCRLDDIAQIDHIDFLKIDIQGGELKVIQNGTRLLSQCLLIQTEVSFLPIYENQPAFGEIDLALRQLGLMPMKFEAIKNTGIGMKPYINQLLEADVVYIKDFNDLSSWQDLELEKIAIILHYCYGSYDLVIHFTKELERRAKLSPGFTQEYLNAVCLHYNVSPALQVSW